MTVRTLICLLLICLVVGGSGTCSTAQAQSYRNQDAATGGIAGAILGGIIGHQNDETPEGALIGGAVGAIAGGILGNARDQEVQRHRAYQHQAWRYRQEQLGRAVTIADVVHMSRSGVSEAVIMNQIQANGVASHIGTREIISMHDSGVNERVITAMQRGRSGGSLPATETVVVERPPPAPRPVVVHREIHVAPPRPIYVPHPRVRYATRPVIPPYGGRVGVFGYW